METIDLLITNANEVLTLQGPYQPRTREQLRELGILSKASVAIHDGHILAVGKDIPYRAENVIDATNKIVLPGFIDPHTHVVFAGSRDFELDRKLKGDSYLDILDSGGGIFYTVNETRRASSEHLFDAASRRLTRMLAYGTTTCEAKSGYGLDLKTEQKILQVQKKLQQKHSIDIVSTFLGAHVIPPEYESDEYVTLVVDEMIPKLHSFATFCDVFCEQNVFTIEQSRRILLKGKEFDLIPKIHADEIVDTGGAALAAEIGAKSADHLLMSNEQGLQAMATKHVIGVLLPGTPFSLMQHHYASARTMIDIGIPIALATDLNPNCWTENMQFMIQLACYMMHMTPAETITAATYNAACAIGVENKVGSIEKGKQADVLVLDCPNHLSIPYHFGVNLVDTVIKNGVQIISKFNIMQ